MNGTLLFRAGTVGKSIRCGRKPTTLLQAAKHNLRETQVERGFRSHIDPSRLGRNQVLHGPESSIAIVDYADQLFDSCGVARSKLRKDHVQALEFIVSLPPGSTVDADAYFNASTTWFLHIFGREMVLSVVRHEDEAAPHIHALIAPLVGDRYVGGAPISRPRLPQLVKLFADNVGTPFGLRFAPATRQTSAERAAAASAVLETLAMSSDAVLSSRVWPAVRADILRGPQGYMEVLGLNVPTPKDRRRPRTFVQIMTSRGRPTEEDGMRRQS